MSLPIPQAAVNTSAIPTTAQQQPQHDNLVFSLTNPSSSQNIPSTPTSENIAFLTKQNEEKLALASSMLNSLNAFLAGDLLPPSVLATEINQVVEEDMDELDMSWNMTMAAFRAEKFQKKYVRYPMSNILTRSLRDKLRCYRCYEPGHFVRDCKKATVGYEATQAAAARNSKRSMADVVAHVESLKIYDIEEVNHQCLMAQTKESKSLSETVNSLLCSKHCRNKITPMGAHILSLINDYNSAVSKCMSLRDNNKILFGKIYALKKDITHLHLDVNQQKCWIHDYKHRLNIKTLECDFVRAELELLIGKYKLIELNIKRFDTSKDTFRNMCNVQLGFKENKGKGLGYNQVPPPYNHSYSRMPTTE
ncbi:putative transcription factor interactor and regulator CCHC(Zn) family [Helianthus anomalus]